MSTFWNDIRVVQSTMLLGVSFAIVLAVFGAIIRKTRMLDYNRQENKSFSRSVSTVLFTLAMIIGIVAVLGFVLSYFI